MKDFHCRDAGMDCDYVARGSTTDEILQDAGHHAEQVHKMKVTPEMAEKVKGLIHDETSPEHQRSMSKRS